MSGFAPEWLDLREGADHRSRNRKLERALAKHFDGWRPVTVVDLGCGTGSNLRATSPLLGPEQYWTLVDHDQALLDAAAQRLAAWADGADRQGGTLALFKGAKRINVEFRRADLARRSRGRARAECQSRHGIGLVRSRLARVHRQARRGRRSPEIGLLHRAHLRRRSALDARARGRCGPGRCLQRPPAARQGLRAGGRTGCAGRPERGLCRRGLRGAGGRQRLAAGCGRRGPDRGACRRALPMPCGRRAKSTRRRSRSGVPSPTPAPSSATATRWPCRRQASAPATWYDAEG